MRASEGLNVSQVDFDGADLSTAADGACDVPADAVGKSVVILRDALGESILVEDRELIHRRFPRVVPVLPRPYGSRAAVSGDRCASPTCSLVIDRKYSCVVAIDVWPRMRESR